MCVFFRIETETKPCNVIACDMYSMVEKRTYNMKMNSVLVTTQ